MGVQNKQIGWSTESNLLWDVLKKISQLTKVVSNISISGGSGVQTVTGNIVNNTDPVNPVVDGIASVTGSLVDNTDPVNPVVDGVATISGNIVDNTDPTNPVVTGLTLTTATATLTTGGWSLVSGLYEQSISNANITSSSIVDIIPNNADASIVSNAGILPRTDSASGSVKVYSTNLPTANIGITLNIWN
jgi:hypothetical protein